MGRLITVVDFLDLTRAVSLATSSHLPPDTLRCAHHSIVGEVADKARGLTKLMSLVPELDRVRRHPN